MTEQIKRYRSAEITADYMMERAQDRTHLLASDIDAGALEAAISALVDETARKKENLWFTPELIPEMEARNNKHITHLSALLAAVRKQ
jgi:chemotaxis methyl-accepting protein methylase